MDVAHLASALTGAYAARTQVAVAASMLRMNAAADSSILATIEAAQRNLDRLANVAAGTGTRVDISV